MGGFNLFSNYKLRGSECNTLGWAQSAQASRAFLQLAPNIKPVYVSKFSLDGHSESAVSDKVSQISCQSCLLSPVAAYICVAGSRRLLVRSAESQDFPHLQCRCQDWQLWRVTATTARNQNTESRWYSQPRVRAVRALCNVFLIEYDGK